MAILLITPIKNLPDNYQSLRAHGLPWNQFKVYAVTDLLKQLGGAANPEWKEWLMGVPIGWTGHASSVTGLALIKLRSGGLG